MPRTVLIVDDNIINCEILGRMLESEYNVVFAGNGKEALDILKREYRTVSLVLLDLIMPVLDGYAVLAEMHNNPVLSPIPVIVTTGDTDIDSERRALSLGANDYITKPYDIHIIRNRVANIIKLRETSAIMNSYQRDKLTGMLSRETFYDTAAISVSIKPDSYYFLSTVDIDNFKMINDRYGTETGDNVLRALAKMIRDDCDKNGGICGRISADNFIVLYPYRLINSEAMRMRVHDPIYLDCINIPVTVSIGRYIIDDRSLAISAMYDRARIAQATVKGRYDTHVAVFDETMRQRMIREQEIVGEMSLALRDGQFEPWFHPIYNIMSGAIVGAEALVRWRHPVRGIISPDEFISLFERNGFIYDMDRSIWEQVCALLGRWIAEGRNPLPISVNISRYDLMRQGFTDTILGLVEKYKIPRPLFRLEITESAFTESTELMINVVDELKEQGFAVEIDDFGSGYSSLNILKDVNANLIKLDMRFLKNNDNLERGGNILESVIRMAKWLGMNVVAEGVETREQADYLCSIGCKYMQGYLCSVPMSVADYENLSARSSKENKATPMQAVEHYNSSSFWDSTSLDTLIFNSYVGAACIFEFCSGKIELIRATEKYVRALGSTTMTIADVLETDWNCYITPQQLESIKRLTERPVGESDEFTDDFLFTGLPGCPERTYLRSTLRLIAAAEGRSLVYCVIENVTEQYEAKQNERRVGARLAWIMDNIDSGISALTFKNGEAHFVFTNERFYSIFGYTRAEYEAEVTDFFLPIHEDDKERVRAAVAATIEKRKPDSLMFRCTKRDGSTVYLRCNITATVMDDEEGPVIFTAVTDISDAAVAHIEEQATSSQMRAFMENIGSGVSAAAVKDGKTQYIYVNDRFYRMFDYTPEEFARECPGGLSDIIFPDDLPEIDDIAERTRVFGGSEQFEFRVRMRDGSTMWVACSSSTCKVAGVDDVVHLAVLTDVTEQKLNAQKMHDTDEQVQFLNDLARDLLAQSDIAVGIERVLNKILLHFGASRAYIIECLPDSDTSSKTYEVCANGVSAKAVNPNGIPNDDFCYWWSEFDEGGYIIIDDVSAMPDQMARERGMLAGQGIHSLIAVPFHRDGTVIGYIGIDDPTLRRDHVSQLRALGDYIAVMLTRRDLTEKIESERRIVEELLNDMPGGVCVLCPMPDGKRRPLLITPKFYEMLGYTKEQFDDGIAVSAEFVHPDDAVTVALRTDEVVSICQPATLEYRAIRADKSEIWLRNELSMIELPGSDRPVLLSVFTDITHNRAISDRLKLLTESIPGGLYTINIAKDGLNVTYFNEGAYSYTGYSRAEFTEIIAHDPLSLIFEEDTAGIYEAVEKLRRGGESGSCIFRARSANGETLWFEMKGIVTQRSSDSITVNVVQFDITDRKMAEEKLRQSEEQFRVATNMIRLSISRYDIKSATYTHTNATLTALGLPGVITDFPKTFIDFGIPIAGSESQYAEFYACIGRGETPKPLDIQLIASTNRSYRWYRMEATVINDVDGKPSQAIIVTSDINEQREKEAIFNKWQQSLADKKSDRYTLFRCNINRDSNNDSVDGTLLSVRFDPAITTFDGRTQAYAQTYVHPDDRRNYIAALKSDTLIADYYRGTRQKTVEFRETPDKFSVRWLSLSVEMVEFPNSNEIEVYLMFEDIDDKKKEELLIREAAEVDPLTGVYNRAAFSAHVGEIFSDPANNTSCALLMIDLDGFKLINDSFGHAAGDQTLVDIADSLRSILRTGDLLGRLGGDEFLILLHNIPNDTSIETKANQICALLRRVYSSEVQISASIGISVYPRDGTDFDTLYRKADAALYTIKNDTKNGHAFYHENMPAAEVRVVEHDRDSFPNMLRDTSPRRRMLIVEDSKTDTELLSAMFKRDFNIITAKDGNSALIRLRHYGTAISVVLLDLYMPGMDGFEVLERMRVNSVMRTIPVVVVSAGDDMEVSLRAIKSGASDFVSKPVDPALISIRVKSAVSKAENERLRAQNSLLSVQTTEVSKYRTVLENNGTIVIEHDWMSGVFTYDSSISNYIAGKYDDRTFWRILLSDFVADAKDVQLLQSLVYKIADDRGRSKGCMTIKLRTPNDKRHRFRINVIKTVNEYGLTDKMILALNDLDPDE